MASSNTNYCQASDVTPHIFYKSHSEKTILSVKNNVNSNSAPSESTPPNGLPGRDSSKADGLTLPFPLDAKLSDSSSSLDGQCRQMEERHVHHVYAQIAPQFGPLRQERWPRVVSFLKSLPPHALVADVGCGNGRFLDQNPSTMTFGSDICPQLVIQAEGQGRQLLVADNIRLPYRDGLFDAAVSIGVVHHFASKARRVLAIQELARILTPGGCVMIYVWAFEQIHRKFKNQDVLIPWKRPEKNWVARNGWSSSPEDQKPYSSMEFLSDDQNSPATKCPSRSQSCRTPPERSRSSQKYQHSLGSSRRCHSEEEFKRRRKEPHAGAKSNSTRRVFGVFDRRDSARLRESGQVRGGDESAAPRHSDGWRKAFPLRTWSKKNLQCERTQSLGSIHVQDGGGNVFDNFQTQLVSECQKMVKMFRSLSANENRHHRTQAGTSSLDILDAIGVCECEETDDGANEKGGTRNACVQATNEAESCKVQVPDANSVVDRVKVEMENDTSLPHNIEIIKTEARKSLDHLNTETHLEPMACTRALLSSQDDTAIKPKQTRVETEGAAFSSRHETTLRSQSLSTFPSPPDLATTKSEECLGDIDLSLENYVDNTPARRCSSMPSLCRSNRHKMTTRSFHDFHGAILSSPKVNHCHGNVHLNGRKTYNEEITHKSNTDFSLEAVGKYIRKARNHVNLFDGSVSKKKYQHNKWVINSSTKYTRNGKLSHNMPKKAITEMFSRFSMKKSEDRTTVVEGQSVPSYCLINKVLECHSPDSQYDVPTIISSSIPVVGKETLDIHNECNSQISTDSRDCGTFISKDSASKEEEEEDEEDEDVFLPGSAVKSGDDTNIFGKILGKLSSFHFIKKINNNKRSVNVKMKKWSKSACKENLAEETICLISEADRRTMRNTFSRKTSIENINEKQASTANISHCSKDTVVPIFRLSFSVNESNQHDSRITKRPNFLDFSKKRTKPKGNRYIHHVQDKKINKSKRISLEEAMTLLGNGCSQDSIVNYLDSGAQIVFSEMKRLNFSIRDFPMSSINSSKKTLLVPEVSKAEFTGTQQGKSIHKIDNNTDLSVSKEAYQNVQNSNLENLKVPNCVKSTQDCSSRGEKESLVAKTMEPDEINHETNGSRTKSVVYKKTRSLPLYLSDRDDNVSRSQGDVGDCPKDYDNAAAAPPCGGNLSEDRYAQRNSCNDPGAENEKSSDSVEDESLRRYYHVFKKNELDDLIRDYVPCLQIVDTFYDHANWCVVASKL